MNTTGETKPNILLNLSFWESIKLLTDEQKGQLLTAIFMQQLDEPIPDLDPVVFMAYSFISAEIRKNNEKYVDVCEKRRKAGRKGAEITNKKAAKAAKAANADSDPAKSANAETQAAKPANADNNKDKYKDNNKDNNNVCVNTHDRASADTHTRTTTRSRTRPTWDEVDDLFRREHRTDAIAFWEYNESKAWPFSLETAFGKWCDRDPCGTQPRPTKKNRFTDINQHEYDFAALEEKLLQEALGETVTS